jgi:hypothetical protein
VRLNSLVVLAGLVLVMIWFWHASMGARERANAAAREACDRLRLVMLDGTVSISRLWFRRGLDGRLHFERTYGFEYTDDGYRRLRGFVVTLGEQVTSVGLASARSLHDPPDGPPGSLPPH